MPITYGTVFQTPTNTPTGEAMRVAVDNPYITKEQFIKHPIAKGLGITASSEYYTDGTLDTMILEASTQINRYTGKHFDRQTIDEIKRGVDIQALNPRLVNVPLIEGPVNQINTVYIQVLQWFIQFSLDYLQLFPEQQYYKIVPLLTSNGNTGSPIPSVLLQQSNNLANVWTNYDFGYSIEITGDTSTASVGNTVYTFTNPLWVADAPITIYKDGSPITTGFTINYRDGTVTFDASQGASVITADFFTYYRALPQDIVQAAILMTAKVIGFYSNPLGTTSFRTGNTAWTWDATKSPLDDQIKNILNRYRRTTIRF